MLWFKLIFVCAALMSTLAEPEPKKYTSQIKIEQDNTNITLTDEERTFLREVESKFGVKSDVPKDTNKIQANVTDQVLDIKPHFPAVIAIEIVNDTALNTKSNGKRTIDANLGYGYRTNSGYSYTYLGKPAQDKGKFMIYPYSQEDIPSSGYNYKSSSSLSYGPPATSVEIHPSQAYELVPVTDEQNKYSKPEYSGYNNIKGLVSPPPAYSHGSNVQQNFPQGTLYTTYNGENFSGLSSHFPSIMSNYLVEPSQLLSNPQYQSAGLTQDHLKPHGQRLEQRVVPVLVLKIPSSYLKNPSAELYANLPQNYPLSQHLNSVNLQELVNSYFKKLGYSDAPKVMAYPNPVETYPIDTPISGPVTNNDQYSNPHAHPLYTQKDYSGVQYSAVQPVMAKYPTSYETSQEQQYYVPKTQELHQQPLQKQQYEYVYRYVPQSQVSAQSQPQYEQPQSQQYEYEASVDDASSNPNYSTQQESHPTPSSESTQYETPSPIQQNVQYTTYHQPSVQYAEGNSAEQYEAPSKNEDYSHLTVSSDHSPSHLPNSYYKSLSSTGSQFGQESPKEIQSYVNSAVHPTQKDSVASYLTQNNEKQRYQYTYSTDAQSYAYQNQNADEAANQGLTISENYPSKDHTIATVLPYSYKAAKKPNSFQSVSYVTPLPSARYQSKYRIMVPKTILQNPTSEKVSYVNSHSMPSNYYLPSSNVEYSPEHEYTVPSHHLPSVGSQKAPSHPRNYHAHPKRNTKIDKSESARILANKQSDKKVTGKKV